MWMDSKILIHLGGVFFDILSAKAWGHLVLEIVKASFSTFLTPQILSLPSFRSLRQKTKISEQWIHYVINSDCWQYIVEGKVTGRKWKVIQSIS